MKDREGGGDYQSFFEYKKMTTSAAPRISELQSYRRATEEDEQESLPRAQRSAEGKRKDTKMYF